MFRDRARYIVLHNTLGLKRVMSQLQPGQKVVAEGTFLYDGTVECDIRIVFGPICYGGGSFDEDTHLHEDMERDTFYVDYGSTTERGVFNAGGGAYPSLAEAMAASATAVGIGASVRWHRVEAQPTVQADAASPHGLT